MLKAVVAVVIPIAMLFSLVQNKPSPDEVAAIKATAMDYGQGWYDGDVERMERALHPDLAKRVLTPDARSKQWRITSMSALSLVQATRKGGGRQTPLDQRKLDVTVLDIFGNAASVKLEMHDWVDYLHMSKINNHWVIVNVLWEFTADAKEKYGFTNGS